MLWISLLLALAVPATAAAGANGPQPLTVTGISAPAEAQYAQDRVLVRFRPSISPAQQASALSAVGAADVLVSYDLVPGLQLVRVAAGSSVRDVVIALGNRGEVEYATPDYEFAPAVTPNDPLFPQQWGMTAIGAQTAWGRTTGIAGATGVKVAVLDTGMQLSHPDLVANLWKNPNETVNGVDDDGNGFVDDINGADFANNDADPNDDAGHGTHVSGIIGAVGNNSVGVAGVNWKVKIMPLKICNATCATSDEIEALDYAVDKLAKVVNSSFGGVHPGNQAEQDAIAAAGAAGILDVIAAGNNADDNDTTPFYPASYPLDNILSVAATNVGGGLASFSNFGAGSVHLGAPGEDVWSTFPTTMGTGYQPLSGTSMAAPHVAGAAALLWAQHPTWTRQQVRNRLLTTVEPLAALAGNAVSCGQLDIATATDPAVGSRALVCAARTGTGGGSVSSSPAGIACGSTCLASFPPGTNVTLTATPESGSTFVGWRGPCTGTGPCAITAADAVTATALFRRNGSPGGWTQAPLAGPAGRVPFAPNSSRSQSFYNVSFSDDGLVRSRTIFNPQQVGGFVWCNFDTSDTGGIFLSRKTATGWVDDGKLIAPAIGTGPSAHWANCDSFGLVTELSGDGKTLLVSQPTFQEGADRYRCATFVYRRGPTGWTLDGTLFPTGVGAAGSDTWQGCSYFGIGAAISRDGSRVAVFGADLTPRVFVEVFVRGLNGWTREQRVGTPACSADSGDVGSGPRMLALSGDGARLLIGDPTCDAGTASSGAGRVFAFTRSGSSWALSQTIDPPENVDRANFGDAVAMSDDGSVATIRAGALFAVWVYERDGTGWHARRKLTPSAPEVSIQCPTIVRGGTRIVCTPYETVGFNVRQGALDVYDKLADGWGSSSLPAVQHAFATDGFAGDLLGRATNYGWSAVAAPEHGTLLDAPIAALNLGLGHYPNDRIGYEFTTPDPLGKLVSSAKSVRNASTGNALSFTYTAATPLAGGTVSLTVPTGWSAPSTIGTNAGYTTASRGTRTISGRSILVSGLTLAAGQTLTIVYGSKAANGPGATAPSSGGDQTWPASARGSAAESLTPLVAPPVITVLSKDGAGTMKPSSTSLPHGSTGQTLTFTYTATAGGLANGAVTLAVPSGWSLPSTNGASPGYSKTSKGTLGVSGSTITVSNVSLSGGQTLVITYGSKALGGPGATAPSSTGTQTWATKERSSSAGVLTNLAAPPAITVT